MRPIWAVWLCPVCKGKEYQPRGVTAVTHTHTVNGKDKAVALERQGVSS